MKNPETGEHFRILTQPLAPLYRCKHCLKTIQLSYRYNGAKPETHQTIVNIAINGSGCRDTARVLKISLNAVLCH
ncbi:hypothetical protein F9222_24735 [Escherichia coli]|nr:hypothetical protein F9222_24735 [Escherichia coli]